VSKSLIYHYYAAKEDILFDVMISHVRALEEAARAVIAGDAPPDAKLRSLARAFMALYVGAADRHKVLLNELSRLPKNRRAEIVSVQRGLIEIVRRLLIAVAPRLSAPRSFTAAMLFFGMINWTHTWFDAEGAVSAEELADLAVSTTLSGLRGAA
jgi:AcrR family transcriptional regulator